MANRRSNSGFKWVALPIAAALGWGAWTAGSALLGDDSEAEGTRYVVNHVWIERLPEGPRDMIGHLAMIDHRQGRIGGAGRSSQWRHFIEIFQWKLDGHRLDLFFPQDEMHTAVGVKTYPCDAPQPFDICMDIEAGRRKVTYYSNRDWEIDPGNAEASLEALTEEHPELANVFELDTSSAELDVDAVDWTETNTLPFK